MQFSSSNRHLVIVSGEQSDCISCAKSLTKDLDTLFLDDPKKANNYLGQEFDSVIFNAFGHFDANAFGAVAGTIRVGGYLLLLKPDTFSGDSLFLTRFESLLKANETFVYIDPLKNQNSLPKLPVKSQTLDFSTCATKDQSNAVDAIIRVVKGHRRRPLVITADRGRGKSAALGIAAAQLIKDDYKNIIVCAPSKKAAAVVFQFAEANGFNRFNIAALKFYSPDELSKKLPKADLVLIDEAAAIPIPLLVSLLKHYSRIVFSTTQHGYEGCGRGFSVNFHKELDKTAAEWKACKLTTPIRWNEKDALEAFIFDALLLDAEPVENALITAAKIENCQVVELNKHTLIKDDKQLRTLFGLLVSAHYQTKPSDLVQMLDDVAITIRALQYKQQIIAVAVCIQEGEIDAELAHDIFTGTRRIKGHLVAQSLAANIGNEEGPTLLGERISRIAVHSLLQQQGFGSYLLGCIVKESKADYLSTSFGATLPVLRFWKKAGFEPVYLGMKRDASSGTHSVIMLCTKGAKGGGVCFFAVNRFNIHFPHLLSEPFRYLESEVALALLNEPNNEKNKHEISDLDKKELDAFAYGQRGYENSIYPLWKFVCNTLSTASLVEDEKRVLLYKVLQKLSWQDVVKQLDGVSGKKEALFLLREALGNLLKNNEAIS